MSTPTLAPAPGRHARAPDHHRGRRLWWVLGAVLLAAALAAEAWFLVVRFDLPMPHPVPTDTGPPSVLTCQTIDC